MHKNWRVLGKLMAFLVLAAGMVASACGQGEGVIEVIVPPEGGGGEGGGDAGTDGGEEEDAGPSSSNCDFSCDGECVPLHPGDSSYPVLVWIGPNDGSGPPCPNNAPVEQFVWFTDLVIPPKKCGPCSCGPSDGTCSLPETITAHAAPCTPPEDTAATATNPPDAWDGTCAADNTIAAGLSCGPETPCVQSVTVGPLAKQDIGCTVIDATGATTAAPPSPSWGRVARVCEGSAFGKCEPDEHCAPKPPADFRQCVYLSGVHACPPDKYTEAFVVYEGFADKRTCTACTCGAPEGTSCHADISIFADAACTVSPLIVSAWSEGTTCHDVASKGRALGAKTAAPPVYQRGSCAPAGGEVEGDVALAGPRTLCCVA
ncbi:hypothetical protein [Polyangium jinanense]|uniref:Lipoprotein n=1 Tax=Polyangium jinanense TaxID=2829994 RepID=A0A9X3X5Y1_9BACT|nr:hypothetical protein [Polyangium jinanense]MDC3955846.1 hypothetical protein [Polyangium jinanense]MDC3983205.1 hypothetical protein [Polyangium jinanense]